MTDAFRKEGEIMELFTVNECRYMFEKEREIIQKVKPIDDGGLGVINELGA